VVPKISRGDWKFQRDEGSETQDIPEEMGVGQLSMGLIQSNLFNMDTKGTEPIVRFTEVSVL